MSSGTIRVSASVVVTTIAHNETDGTFTLDVAVFWRGTPGWFTAGDPGGQSGGATSTGLPDGRPGPETHFIGVGGLRLEVQFDPGTGRVRIQDQSISSQSGNVILVDEVDGAADRGRQHAAEYFRHAGFRNLYNLTGGIDSWSLLVNLSVPRY
jgi:hypothetical protein